MPTWENENTTDLEFVLVIDCSNWTAQETYSWILWVNPKMSLVMRHMLGTIGTRRGQVNRFVLVVCVFELKVKQSLVRYSLTGAGSRTIGSYQVIKV